MLKSQQILQERYQLQEQLSNNPTRQTWRAENIQSKQQVIVKLLPFSPQTQWQDIKLFEREAQVLQHLELPQIPRYLDYFSVDKALGGGLPWFALVQEYIPGSSLQQFLKTGKTFTEAEAKEIATQLLEILIDLHELSPPVLHRDLKPSNIIQGKDKQIYLVDFGAVQEKAKAEGATFTVVGTGGYAPPEQLWGRAVAASDLYALGATLVHLLTGVAPGELPQHRMRLQFRDKVSLSPEFAGWLDKLLDPAVEKRFARARQALAALQATERKETGPKVRYGRLGKLALLQYGAVGLCGLALPLFAAYRYTHEGKINVGSMNRAQQAYFLEENEFADSIEELGLGIRSQTENYEYEAVRTPLFAMNYAIPRKDKLKGYMGIVVLNGTETSARPEVFTTTLICEDNTKKARNLKDRMDSKLGVSGAHNVLNCPFWTKEISGAQEIVPTETSFKLAYRALDEATSPPEGDRASKTLATIPDPEVKARAFETVILLQTALNLNRDLQLAETIEDEEAKARILLAIARRHENATTHQRVSQSRARAFSILQPIALRRDDSYKRWLLKESFSSLTNPEQLEQAVAIARSIKRDRDKIEIVRALLPQLRTSQQADGVLQIIPSFEDSERENAGYKSAALKEIAPYLTTPQQFDKVLQMTRTIKEDQRKAAVLIAIAPRLTIEKQYREALSLAETLENEMDKAEAIRSLQNARNAR